MPSQETQRLMLVQRTQHTPVISASFKTVSDRDYLIEAANAIFPKLNLSASDVESSWTGLRPLIHQEGKSSSEISRKDEIFYSQSGLISIAGGKLTGYHKMAETIVDEVVRQLESKGSTTYPASQTKNMPISGGDVGVLSFIRASSKEK